MTLDELRPFPAISYWLDSRLFGAANAQGYHATNVVLHMLNGLLVLAIARSVAPEHTAVALLAASLFVLMPSHAEPIAWISGRVDSIAALFSLGAFLCFVQFRLRQRREWLIASVVSFVCGLFAKQSVIILPLLILAYDVVYAPVFHGATRVRVISRYASHVPFFLLLAAYLWLRHNLFGNAVREELLTIGAFKEFAFRQFFYLTKLLPVADSASSTTRALLAATIVLLLTVSAWSLFVSRSRNGLAIRRVIFFGAVWYAITVAPMVVSYSSARHLYLTAAGISIALASLIVPGRLRAETRGRMSRIIAAVALVVLSALALRGNIGPWIENGVESQKTATALSALLRSVPRGSVVLIDVRETARDAAFWTWGFPFALQKPFVPQDLYDQFAIVEHPGVYCCPAYDWWRTKQTVLTSLFNSPGLSEVSAIVPVPQSPGSFMVVTRGVSGAALRLKIESTIGRPIETISPKSSTEAERLMGILLEPHLPPPPS